MSKVLTDAEYVDFDGCICPFCRSNDVESTGGFEADSDYASRSVKCNDCDRTWSETYTLTGWSED